MPLLYVSRPQTITTRCETQRPRFLKRMIKSSSMGPCSKVVQPALAERMKEGVGKGISGGNKKIYTPTAKNQ